MATNIQGNASLAVIKQGDRQPTQRNFPTDMKVADARAQWLEDNGLDPNPYNKDFKLLGINFGQGDKLMGLLQSHDLHHVATGYGTDYIGELEISAWETAARGPMLARLIGAFGTLAALVVSPKRIYNAFKAGLGAKSIYATEGGAGVMLGCTVGQMRQQLGVPLAGLGQKTE